MLSPRARPSRKPGSPLSFFEFWPGWLFYTPVVIHWLMLGLRHGDFSLPTAANPRITTGGLCGEFKLSILDAGRSGGSGPGRPRLRRAGQPRRGSAAEAAMAAFGLNYPIVAKPDIGCNGTGVRLVRIARRWPDTCRRFRPAKPSCCSTMSSNPMKPASSTSAIRMSRVGGSPR